MAEIDVKRPWFSYENTLSAVLGGSFDRCRGPLMHRIFTANGKRGF